MDEEGRRVKRRHLIYYLEVYDDETNELLGHVVDITSEGVKLVSKNPIETGQVFRLRMMLPEGYFDEKVLRFSGKCLWSTNDINPDFYDAGFALTTVMDTQGKDILFNLIEQLGFND